VQKCWRETYQPHILPQVRNPLDPFNKRQLRRYIPVVLPQAGLGLDLSLGLEAPRGYIMRLGLAQLLSQLVFLTCRLL